LIYGESFSYLEDGRLNYSRRADNIYAGNNYSYNENYFSIMFVTGSRSYAGYENYYFDIYQTGNFNPMEPKNIIERHYDL
jgi:hypothetical protein